MTPGKQVDHIVPLAKGGTDDLENLQLLCIECHKIKTQREANGLSGFYDTMNYETGFWEPDADWAAMAKERTQAFLSS